MTEERRLWTRREVLAGGLGLAGLALGINAQSAEQGFTQPLSPGPFYPLIKPLDQDADLTIIKGSGRRAKGDVIHVAGRVLNKKGEPVRNAKIEVWQADSNGRYSHRSDPNKAPLDPDFQGYAVLHTDDDGRYRFKTIMPAPYPGEGLVTGIRSPHIHFDVYGKYDRITTQMFFPDQSLNKTDAIFQSIRSDARKAALTARLMPDGTVVAGEQLFSWDVILLSG